MKKLKKPKAPKLPGLKMGIATKPKKRKLKYEGMG